MDSIFDWFTVITFSGLAVLYLHRSVATEPMDKIWQYLPPALGCIAVNYLGDHGFPVVALIMLVAIFAYINYVLKPLRGP